MPESPPTGNKFFPALKANGRAVLRRYRRIAFVITGVILLASLTIGWRIAVRTNTQLEKERERLAKLNLVPFEKTRAFPIDEKGLEIWQSYKGARSVAKYNDSYFVATDGGLVELATSGELKRHYTVLDGLPESDLISLAVYNARLFIGTRTQGLVQFDGERFESYKWTDRTPQAVNALVEDKGRLLIGTIAGGLIEFDGQVFREIKTGPDHKRLVAINFLSVDDSRLYVGTFADGLWIQEGARWSHFTATDGLLSNRIIGVVPIRQNLYVASDYGLAVASLSELSAEPVQSTSKRFRTVAILPSLSGITRFRNGVLLCKDDGEVFALPEGDNMKLGLLAWDKPGDLKGCRFDAIENEVWLVTSEGIRRTSSDMSQPAAPVTSRPFPAFGQLTDSKSLTTNTISALSFDSHGSLWAGSFRNGIDLLDPQGNRLTHLESDTLREINSLVEDKTSNTMIAATSQGILRLDGNFRILNRWSTADGLLSNSVMQIVKADAKDASAGNTRNAEIACATGKGLSIGTPGNLRGLTTVQGLPGNSLYTVLYQGRRLYAGTLGGLAVIEEGRVVRVYRDTNSSLTNNWITALCLADTRVFAGTYGSGIFELTASGELQRLPETGQAVINPNAMWSDGKQLYAGTLDGALVFDLQSQKWSRLKSELPARTVLSVTADEKYVYFGTTSGIARIERSYKAQAE